jgi:signal transduction histidine kinase
MGMDEQDRIRRALRHDLRNPLAVILGRCEMLASGAMGDLSVGQERSVEAIQRNADRLVQMLDALASEVESLPFDE